jgi:transcription antitermination factor NusG
MAVNIPFAAENVVLPVVSPENENWYALHTLPRHERAVVHKLTDRGVQTFLPTVTEVHRWSDRKKSVQMPLFSCYVFAKFRKERTERLNVLRVGGVLGLIGNQGEGTPIPDAQIDTIRTLVDRELPFSPCPFLRIGQRVRIRGGALEGLEGTFEARNGSHTLVISIDAIERSLAVRLEGYRVEAA